MEWRNRQDLTRATSWCGGRVKISKYWYVYKPDHPNAMHGKRYVAEHRLVMEGLIGRFLTPHEDVHHIDENTENNEPSNLELVTHKQHSVKSANKKGRKQNGQFTTTQIQSVGYGK